MPVFGLGATVRFEVFVFGVLERDPQIELTTASSAFAGPSVGQDFSVDFVATRKGRPVLIQVNLITPQTGARLARLTVPLQAAAERYRGLHRGGEPDLVLACAGVVSESMRSHAKQAGLEVWDGPYLRARARQLGIDPIRVPPEVAAESDARSTHVLLNRLDHIEPGIGGWSSFEKYCEDLLNFLFVPPLSPAIPQSRDSHNANRRDYILPNYALDGGFWQFVRLHYGAFAIVVEVKNLRDCPGKDEILQVTNYLNPHGTGLFALVLARKELNETARWICREQWIQHNKLIVGIHDEDVRQMVETKLTGNDPAELVRQKIEDFRLARVSGDHGFLRPAL